MIPEGNIYTLPERCRVCYTCVRECPAKAIRITEGQAKIVVERCIGCGNCVRICSQGAKQVVSSIDRVRRPFAQGDPVVAWVAPSFPAEFTQVEPGRVVGLIRALGFAHVHDVAFGADLVAAAYRELLERNLTDRFIATSCPAVVQFVEKYHPDLLQNLAPLVSPMVAMARVVRKLHGSHVSVVFIGPCVAKKGEADDELVRGDVDAVLTFAELREMAASDRLDSGEIGPSEIDAPYAGTGALFPIARGMLQAAKIDEDLLAGIVVAADGRIDFVAAIKEFASGDLDARLLEVLACKGCVMGAGMTSTEPLFSRRASVSRYVRERMLEVDETIWRKDMARFADVDLSRLYASNDQRASEPSRDKLRVILTSMGKLQPEDELNCGACGYDTCLEHAIAIHKELAESEMCLPYTIDKLHSTVGELANTQEALIQSEKLASMGQLSAGIAHEINNPLGVVLMYAHLLREEMSDDPKMVDDLTMIVEQADRCKK